MSRELVLKEMQNCSFFVLTSNYETFGIVIIEALSCGKPVVSTKCVGPEEIINDTNGLLVEKENVKSLSKGLVYMYKNINNYNSKQIRENCVNLYGEKSFILQINKAYKKVLQRRNI